MAALLAPPMERELTHLSKASAASTSTGESSTIWFTTAGSNLPVDWDDEVVSQPEEPQTLEAHHRRLDEVEDEAADHDGFDEPLQPPEEDEQEERREVEDNEDEEEDDPHDVSELLEPKITLLFQLPGGPKKTVYIRNRPLGVGFKRNPLLIVHHVREGEWGHEVGIRRGWALLAVDGQTDASCKETAMALHQGLKTLPHVEVGGVV